MTTDKLKIKGVAALSEAVAEHISDLSNILEKDVQGNWIVVIDEGAGEPFDTTDPRCWMMIVEAMPKEMAFHLCLNPDRSGIFKAIRGKWSARFYGNLGQDPNFSTHASPGIAVSLAALRARGVDVEYQEADNEHE